MSQSYILTGEPEQTRAYAMNMAKTLNCLAGNEVPCGECLSCRVFDSGNHPDTVFVTGTKASGIGVDDVREQIIMPIATKPFKYKYKVFVINKAETLTPAAQNALLKTIEEPAPYGVFLFAAPHAHNFLPTVLSRCTLRKLNNSPTNKSPDADLATLAKEIADTVHEKDMLGVFALYRRFEPYKDSKETLQELLSLIYGCYGKKITNAVRQNQSPSKAWFNATQAIARTKQVLSQNGNTQLAIELMLVKLNEKV